MPVDSSQDTSLLVSVVVPIYNPGEFVQPLLDSLAAQTLPAERFEAVLVDDGSTDGSAQRLDAWAARRDNVTVIHQENHGWPGQPRNLGVERSRGRYVMFVDQDDWLGEEALQRLTDFAVENDSDVVIPKMVGIDRSVPRNLFKRTYPRAELGRTPVQDSMTPHKMFRRAFLEAIDLRFPEGKRRLEDHLYVTKAFVAASVISVYSDYDCYFHISRTDGGNAGFRSYDPVQYYSNLEDVFDVIDGAIPPGPVRDRLYTRWLRIELVGRWRSLGVRSLGHRERQSFYGEISRLVRDRVPLGSLAMVDATTALWAGVIRHVDGQRIFDLESRVRGLRLRAESRSSDVALTVVLDGEPLPARVSVASVLSMLLDPTTAAAIVADMGREVPLLPNTIALTSRSRIVEGTRLPKQDVYSVEQRWSLALVTALSPVKKMSARLDQPAWQRKLTESETLEPVRLRLRRWATTVAGTTRGRSLVARR